MKPKRPGLKPKYTKQTRPSKRKRYMKSINQMKLLITNFDLFNEKLRLLEEELDRELNALGIFRKTE